jgi:hypothetical protein
MSPSSDERLRIGCGTKMRCPAVANGSAAERDMLVRRCPYMVDTQGRSSPDSTGDQPFSSASRSHCSLFFFPSLDFSRYVSLSRGQYCFVQCSTIRSFESTSPTRANKGTTTMATHPIHRRATTTNRIMPQILSLLPKIIIHTLSRQLTRHRLKSTNRIIRPWATILSTRLTANHPRQITTNHPTLRLPILFTPSPHHRHPFNRTCSSRTLLSPPTNLSMLATSISPTSLNRV